MNQRSVAAIFSAPHQPLELKSIALPLLKEGEILVKNEYVTLCRSDLKTFNGERTEKTPCILGHEIVGRIHQLGDTDRTDSMGNLLKIGDRISWAIYASNPNGPLSSIGIPQKEADLFKYGHERLSDENTLNGGLSEYTLLRKYTPVAQISTDISAKVAALINCSVSTVAGALRLADESIKEHVIVSGAGMLGIMACSMLKSKGTAHISVIDTDAARAKRALDFGADRYFLSAQEAIDQLSLTQSAFPRASAVLEFSGSASAVSSSLALLQIGGKAIWVGATFPQKAVPIDAEWIIRNLITIKGLHNYNLKDFLSAIEFIEAHHLTYNFDALVHEFDGIHQVNEAFKYALNSAAYRVGIHL